MEIFPQALAATTTNSHELAERYCAVYPMLKQLDKHNRLGTYFLRFVSYPTGAGSGFDQLSDVIRKLREEMKSQGPKSARYEVNIESVTDREQSTANESTHDSGGDEYLATGTLGVYAAAKDTNPMSFPCLSFCAFQLDRDILHMVAHYRSQYLVQRGYGNYLGLGQLLGYVCDAVGATPGQLLVLAGYAQLDPPVSKARIKTLINKCAAAG
jgi:thymidylate synthase